MPAEPLVLALDAGTTSVRAVLYNAVAAAVAQASRPLTQHYPAPGWVEHDAEEIFSAVCECATEVRHRHPAGVVAAIGITNQRETAILWDRASGRPLHRALVWQDRRTAPRCHRLRAEGLEPELRESTGLVADPYFSATKFEWLLTNVPGAAERARNGDALLGTVDTWLIWRLTGGRVHATDRTNASRTLLWNLSAQEWDPRLLELFRVPRSALPDVRDSMAEFGAAAALPGFREEAPILGVAGDQQAALAGHAGWSAGAAKNTYGTGCFLLFNTGAEAPRSRHGLLTTAACGARGARAFALEGSVFIAGAVVQWLRDELSLVASSEETEAVAAQVEDSGGVVIVPAFTGLGAPHWNAGARGTILGLTRGTGRAHLVRAALEAIALQTCDVVEAMVADAGRPIPTLRADGGASGNNLLMQIQADLLGIPVERAEQRETTAYGAAGLAALQAGVWTPELFAAGARVDRTFEPRLSAERRETARALWRRAVERARDWLSAGETGAA